MEDPVWQASYKQHVNPNIDMNDSSTCRFRDWGSFKYVFRSMDINMPWINNVFLIVATESQVPSWLDTTKVRVVQHKDFIPAEYLPVFNSNTIEMFLSRIKGLSDRYIYSNDDIFFLNPLQAADFFDANNKPVVQYLVKGKVNSAFLKVVKRTFDTVLKDFNHAQVKEGTFYKPYHICQPMAGEIVKTVSILHEEQMLQSITRTRDNEKNLNQYLYTDYEILMGMGKPADQEMANYFSFDNYNIGDLAQLLLVTPAKLKVLCINDTDAATPDIASKVPRLLDIKFPNKCKYEK